MGLYGCIDAHPVYRSFCLARSFSDQWVTARIGRSLECWRGGGWATVVVPMVPVYTARRAVLDSHQTRHSVPASMRASVERVAAASNRSRDGYQAVICCRAVRMQRRTLWTESVAFRHRAPCVPPADLLREVSLCLFISVK